MLPVETLEIHVTLRYPNGCWMWVKATQTSSTRTKLVSGIASACRWVGRKPLTDRWMEHSQSRNIMAAHPLQSPLHHHLAMLQILAVQCAYAAPREFVRKCVASMQWSL
jgi:hypothetical protein